MKFVLVLGALCLLAVVSAKKAEKEYSKDKTHHLKKYGKDAKPHHQHEKMQKTLLDNESQKTHKEHYVQESKKNKHVPKSAPHNIPQQEAELQADIKTSKKYLKEQQQKEILEDLHLQDLTHEENLNQGHDSKGSKSPHQYQRGHHKTSHHFAHHKAQKQAHVKETAPAEEKLFADQEPKEPETSHPVLEDSFEALHKEVPKEQAVPEVETKKSSKKSHQHKKAFDKEKKDKKDKKQKKNKQKKDKKQL